MSIADTFIWERLFGENFKRNFRLQHSELNLKGKFKIRGKT